jgi:hypothetical protein
MERRSFLKAGASSVLGAAALDAGCASEKPLHRFTSPSPDPDAVEECLARIDRRMEAMAQMNLAPSGLLRPAEAALLEQRVGVVRAASRSFFITGAFLDLSEQDRLHPGVQERMRRMQPEMDQAVNGIADLLDSLTPDERRRVQQQFRRDPETGSRVSELFHQTAVEGGFSARRRLDLRLALDGLARRMRAQNPSLVIDPCVRKVRKVQANPGTDAERARAFAARFGEQGFWELQERAAVYTKAWDQTYSTRPRTDLALLDKTYPDKTQETRAEDPRHTAKSILSVGGWIMGFGLISEAVGGIAALAKATDVALFFGVTVGPILLAIGLLVVIVGGIWYLATSP